MARSFECKSGLGFQNPSWVFSYSRERIIFLGVILRIFLFKCVAI
jgi:hypothetical protein